LITKRISSPPEELGVTGRSSGLEPGERVGKPQLIKAPRETEPPEVISIEMTPEEQDVYALMGISPLVRLNREIKNPKSVILSVVLPGESTQAEISNETVVDESTETPLHAPTSDEAGISEMRRITLPTETPYSAQPETFETVSMTSSVETSAPESPTNLLPNGDSDSSSTLIRRRRRRSSALDSDDSTAE
jgi:ribonuclease E